MCLCPIPRTRFARGSLLFLFGCSSLGCILHLQCGFHPFSLCMGRGAASLPLPWSWGCVSLAFVTGTDSGCEFLRARLPCIHIVGKGVGSAGVGMRGEQEHGRRGHSSLGAGNPFVDFPQALCLYFCEQGFYFRFKWFCTFACLLMIIVIYILSGLTLPRYN